MTKKPKKNKRNGRQKKDTTFKIMPKYMAIFLVLETTTILQKNGQPLAKKINLNFHIQRN